MHGDITYNGSGLHEFVPQRTASYVSQVDDHIGEMTVRETFDFSVRPAAVLGSAVELSASSIGCALHAYVFYNLVNCECLGLLTSTLMCMWPSAGTLPGRCEQSRCACTCCKAARVGCRDYTLLPGLEAIPICFSCKVACHSALTSQCAAATCSYTPVVPCADMLMSLLRKEREMGITPDPAVDAYLKARPLASCTWVSER